MKKLIMLIIAFITLKVVEATTSRKKTLLNGVTV